MRFWWVNHKQTYSEEVGGNFIWSPKVNSDGSRSPYYDNLPRVSPGDIVFSYANGLIRQVGEVTAHAETSPKPFTGGASVNWQDEGWLVRVNFEPLLNPFSPKNHFDVLGPVLPVKYSPLTKSGGGTQAYFFPVEGDFLAAIVALLGSDLHNTLAMLGASMASNSALEDEIEQQLSMRTDLNVYHVAQLVKARRGQGIFRSNVSLLEKRCRVTGLEFTQHLIASHIKPWAVAEGDEKIDGANGLLLSPHVDHLFDRGFISFQDNGQLILSRDLQYRVLKAWHINEDANVGDFSRQQSAYLEYHRDAVLQRPA